MTDLELTRLCAEAMGLRVDPRWPTRPVAVLPNKTNYRGRYRYDPLHDDAQAMALLKRFHLTLDTSLNETWLVRDCDADKPPFEGSDLNRAIVECVADIQRATYA